jgi:hypothetical protein
MQKKILFYVIYIYLLKNIIKNFDQYNNIYKYIDIINDDILMIIAFIIIIYNLIRDILSCLYFILSYLFLIKKNTPIIKKYFLRDRTLIKKPNRLLF